MPDEPCNNCVSVVPPQQYTPILPESPEFGKIHTGRHARVSRSVTLRLVLVRGVLSQFF